MVKYRTRYIVGCVVLTIVVIVAIVALGRRCGARVATAESFVSDDGAGSFAGGTFNRSDDMQEVAGIALPPRVRRLTGVKVEVTICGEEPGTRARLRVRVVKSDPGTDKSFLHARGRPSDVSWWKNRGADDAARRAEARSTDGYLPGMPIGHELLYDRDTISPDLENKNERRNFFKAKDECSMRGRTLASVRNYQDLYHLTKTLGSGTRWIGYTDCAQEGTFTNADGTPFWMFNQLRDENGHYLQWEWGSGWRGSLKSKPALPPSPAAIVPIPISSTTIALRMGAYNHWWWGRIPIYAQHTFASPFPFFFSYSLNSAEAHFEVIEPRAPTNRMALRNVRTRLYLAVSGGRAVFRSTPYYFTRETLPGREPWRSSIQPDNHPYSGTQMVWRGHLYRVNKEKLTWEAHEAKAKQQGMHIASIADAAENEKVRQFANKHGLFDTTVGMWLGATGVRQARRRAGNGPLWKWRWADGMPFTFTKWHRGEPNDWNNSGQDHIQMWTHGGNVGNWDDVGSHQAKLGAIYKKKIGDNERCRADGTKDFGENCAEASLKTFGSQRFRNDFSRYGWPVDKDRTLRFNDLPCSASRPYICGEKRRHCRMKRICAHFGASAPSGCLRVPFAPMSAAARNLRAGDGVVLEVHTNHPVTIDDVRFSIQTEEYDVGECFQKVSNLQLVNTRPLTTRTASRENALEECASDRRCVAVVESGPGEYALHEHVGGSQQPMRLLASTASSTNSPLPSEATTATTYVNLFG